MDVNEEMDREVIIERAESLRSWLSELSLSSRSISALEREIAGIIADDPGGYINGRRPLAGLTVDELLVELDRPNAGAVGRVRSVGDRVIAELRAAVARPIEAPQPEPSLEPAAAEAAPVEAELDADPVVAEAIPAEVQLDTDPVAAEDAAPAAELIAAPAATTEAIIPKRGRGRPRRVPAVDARAPGAPMPQADVAPARASAARSAPALLFGSNTTLDTAAAPAAQLGVVWAEAAPTNGADSGYDPSLDRLLELWPSLHAQGRRAIVLYASTLLFAPILDS